MSDQQLDMEGVLVERDDVAVMFKRVADDQAGITQGWAELEAAIGSLRGRKFYGAMYAPTGEYRVCVQMHQDDQPEGMGLDVGTLPGGRYLRVTLHGEPPAVYELIAPTFEQLAKRADADPSRPGIEFYRRRDTIELLLPVS